MKGERRSGGRQGIKKKSQKMEREKTKKAVLALKGERNPGRRALFVFPLSLRACFLVWWYGITSIG
jgi:hypothetical protein